MAIIGVLEAVGVALALTQVAIYIDYCQYVLDGMLARLATEKPSSVARDYGVTRQAIADIGRGKTWSHIPRPEPTRRRRKVWES